MASDELFSDTMYRQHVIAHIYLLQVLLQDDVWSSNVCLLIPTREKLDRMSVVELMTLFDLLCRTGKTVDADAVQSVRSTLLLY